MTEWRTMSLQEAGIALLDCVHKTPSAQPVGLPYISIPQMRGGELDPNDARKISHADFYEWTKKANPRKNDIVLSRRCNPGETAYVRGNFEFALGQNLVLLRSNGMHVKPEFLRWLVRGPEWWEQIEKYLNVGAVFDSLRCADVPRFELTIPPLDMQCAIAELMGALDDKIELNRRMNETLEAMARALFKDWFVDFGPTRAKMDGREPYLAPDLWDLFPDRLDPDGKPEEWKEGTLAEVADLNPESWTDRDPPLVVRYVDLSNTKWGDINKVEDFTWAKAPSRARRVLRRNDIVVGTVRPANGAFAIVGEDGLTGSTGFAVLRPKRTEDFAFVWASATAPDNIDRLAHLADGAAYPAVRPGVVAETPTPTAPQQVLAAFSNLAGPLLARAQANRTESRILAQTRDLLLPKLMSGEIRLKDAEKAVEAVA